jgi:hypothetical protein
MILLFGSPLVFGLIWFPANLGAYLGSRSAQRDRQQRDSSLALLVFSGCVFILCGFVAGKLWISAHQKLRPQTHAAPEPQRQVELKDIKGIIDDFCAKERRGEKLTPADGIFGTMQQLASLSTPEAIRYMADNLGDNSGFLWVIAGNPNCTPEQMARFLSIPSTHRFLASNPAAWPELLESLSHSTNAQVRARVAAHPSTLKATLEHLTSDPDSTVSNSAKRSLSRETQHP